MPSSLKSCICQRGMVHKDCLQQILLAFFSKPVAI